MKAKAVYKKHKLKLGQKGSNIGRVLKKSSSRIYNSRPEVAQVKFIYGNIFQEELVTIKSFVEYTPSLTPVPGKGIKISR